MLFTLINASSCNKPDPEPQLPSGENTVYYYLDGTLEIPVDNIEFNTKAIKIYYCNQTNTSFQIYFTSSSHSYLKFFLMNGIQNIGNIILNQGNYSDCDSLNSFGYFYNEEWFSYYSYFSQNNSGTVNITYLSTDKKQFKGTFEMDLYDNNNSVKHITGGYFNINLDTLND